MGVKDTVVLTVLSWTQCHPVLDWCRKPRLGIVPSPRGRSRTSSASRAEVDKQANVIISISAFPTALVLATKIAQDKAMAWTKPIRLAVKDVVKCERAFGTGERLCNLGLVERGLCCCERPYSDVILCPPILRTPRCRPLPAAPRPNKCLLSTFDSKLPSSSDWHGVQPGLLGGCRMLVTGILAKWTCRPRLSNLESLKTTTISSIFSSTGVPTARPSSRQL